MVFDVECKNRGSIEVIDWNIEEVLNLCGVQIKCQYVINFGFGDYICNQFGGDWCVCFGVVILMGIVKVWYYCGDVICR